MILFAVLIVAGVRVGKEKGFIRRKVKITAAYLMAMCAKISCYNGNMLFPHNNTHLAVMKVRRAGRV